MIFLATLEMSLSISLLDPKERSSRSTRFSFVNLEISSRQLFKTMDLLQDSLNASCSTLSFRELEMVFKFTKSRSRQPLRCFAVAMMACTVLDGSYYSSAQEMERTFKEIDGAVIEILDYIPMLLLKYGTHKDPRYRTDDPVMDEKGFDICEFHQHKFSENCDSKPNERRIVWD